MLAEYNQTHGIYHKMVGAFLISALPVPGALTFALLQTGLSASCAGLPEWLRRNTNGSAQGIIAA